MAEWNNNSFVLLSFFPKHLSHASKGIHCISQNSNTSCYYDWQSAEGVPDSNITNVITIIGVM